MKSGSSSCDEIADLRHEFDDGIEPLRLGRKRHLIHGEHDRKPVLVRDDGIGLAEPAALAFRSIVAETWIRIDFANDGDPLFSNPGQHADRTQHPGCMIDQKEEGRKTANPEQRRKKHHELIDFLVEPVLGT